MFERKNSTAPSVPVPAQKRKELSIFTSGKGPSEKRVLTLTAQDPATQAINLQ